MTRVRRFGAATFRSLHVRNYRLFFIGQLISVTGTWMQQIAQDWLVLDLTDSGVAVGITIGLQFLPMLLFGLVGGVVADRFDKRRVLLITQSAAGVLAAVMGALVVTGVVELWMVYVLAFLLGTVTAFDNPTRQAFVVEMVGADEVTNAVGLNSAVFNSARVLGPAIAAILIETVGLSWAFFANSLSYIAALTALSLMDTYALHRSERGATHRGALRRGVQYVRATPELRSTIALVAVVATFGMNLAVVLPLMAKFTFHGGAGTYGFLMAVMSVGALAGALAAAARTRPSATVRVAMAAAFGVSEVATAFAPNIAFAAVGLLVTGATVITFMAMSNTTLQLASAPHMRGRVMALYGLVFLGSTPIGGPIVGWMSEQWNPRVGLAVGGLATLVAALVAWTRLPEATRASSPMVERLAAARGMLRR
jgi:MFS family permease